MSTARGWLRTPLARYLTVNLALLVGGLLFLLLDRYDVFDYILVCPFHLLGVYCATCGMTRAAHALLRLDLSSVLALNPLILLLLAVLLYYEVCGAVAALRGERALLGRARRWPIVAFLIVLFLFFILRNVLLFGFGIDPVGDMTA